MYARPSNLDDALGLLAESGARVIAGGTDIYPGAGERPLQGGLRGRFQYIRAARCAL